MIDHLSLTVSDYQKSKAFYLKALAPLGYSLFREYLANVNPSGADVAGFGSGGVPDFWVASKGSSRRRIEHSL